MQRQSVSSGTPWEEKAGYSRVVRVGAFVYVSGTTAADATGAIQYPGDLYGQAVYIFDKIGVALQSVGAELGHVVRTRVYITHMAQAEQVMRAHHNYFDAIRPANTLVEVSQLATPEMLVEIEVDAVVED
ncbi:MAG: RidA family protein [Merismopedia sp. SIO2A8]|nr:RidA family protein [Merismopedia sp. SIO2A8]